MKYSKQPSIASPASKGPDCQGPSEASPVCLPPHACQKANVRLCQHLLHTRACILSPQCLLRSRHCAGVGRRHMNPLTTAATTRMPDLRQPGNSAFHWTLSCLGLLRLCRGLKYLPLQSLHAPRGPSCTRSPPRLPECVPQNPELRAGRQALY